ncbi:hypothetical protein PRZ48_009353 [Zasmidium cellare]|uniref:Peptidase C15, pyroglutamyl peptidase I-like protein n=1 Tax=Zasmidium cellare TaxID=395010 RepID=A0ABR0ECA3_ZASCE|nr:hypothetical protein PRZ48_009353 [Zasmidium cellare]
MTKTEFSVLVTGFGANLNAPYGNATSNPASLIARSLPQSLSFTHSLNSTNATITFIDPIAGNFAELGGDYSTKRRRIKDLHDQYGATVDLWVHLGRGPWSFITCERRAFRQDFTSSWLGDDARKGYYLYRDNEKKTAKELGHCPWKEAGVPIGLESEIDVNGVVEGSNGALKKMREDPLEVRSHVEAGDAGCGFTFYESMANCVVDGRRRHVLFCHVPRSTEEVEIQRATEAVLAIVGASVEYIVAREGSEQEVDWKQEFGRVP